MVNCVFCSNCGSKVEDSKKFCSECGSKIQNKKLEENFIFCSNCGSKFNDFQKFCDSCGTGLQRNQANENTSEINVTFGLSSFLAKFGISGILASVGSIVSIPFLLLALLILTSYSSSENDIALIIFLLSFSTGLIGIWLESKDEKVATLQYMVTGFMYILYISIFGAVIGIIFAPIFLLAAIFRLKKNKKPDNEKAWNDLYSIPIFCSLIFTIILIIKFFII